MRAIQLFALVIGLTVAIGIAFSRMRSDPKKPPLRRVRKPDGTVVEMPVQRSNGTVDTIGDDGIRMSAINTNTEVQCDVFAGDSAKWAFGYAYDNRSPRCGHIR
jgi:hypothetical protein